MGVYIPHHLCLIPVQCKVSGDLTVNEQQQLQSSQILQLTRSAPQLVPTSAYQQDKDISECP